MSILTKIACNIAGGDNIDVVRDGNMVIITAKGYKYTSFGEGSDDILLVDNIASGTEPEGDWSHGCIILSSQESEALEKNTIRNTDRTLVAGDGNSSEETRNAIVLGSNNTIEANYPSEAENNIIVGNDFNFIDNDILRNNAVIGNSINLEYGDNNIISGENIRYAGDDLVGNCIAGANDSLNSSVEFNSVSGQGHYIEDTYSCLIFGVNNNLTNDCDNTIVGGSANNVIYADDSAVFGNDNTADSATSSLIAGTGNKASSSEDSIIVGTENDNDGCSNVMMLGQNLKAYDSNCVILGRYNAQVKNGNEVFSVGNGRDEESRHNVLSHDGETMAVYINNGDSEHTIDFQLFVRKVLEAIPSIKFTDIEY